MRFFHIPAAPNDPAIRNFASACRARDVEYAQVLPGTLDTVLQNPPARGDLLYSASVTAAHLQVELLLTAEGVTTFHRLAGAPIFSRLVGRGRDTLLLEKYGVPVPRTIYFVTDERDRLSDSVDRLGGFPVVLKTATGSFGVGVIKVSDPAMLFSVASFIRWKRESGVIMQEFVEHQSVLQVICIGERVIVGRRRLVPGRDFRSNSTGSFGPDPMEGQDVFDFNDSLVDVAVAATRASGHDCCSVTVIEAADGRLLVSKVRHPFVHLDIEATSGVPISALMVDYLVAKSRKQAEPSDSTVPTGSSESSPV